MNAVIYARYSSASQTEQSIEGQLRVCNEYAERNGYNIIKEYIDRATTGTTDERPSFLQMIEDAKKKEFQYIIVYKLDRFSRNRYDSVFYKHKLQQLGIRVISAMEAISDTQEGKLVEGLLEMIAEMYSHDLSQKVKRGLKESVLKGTFTGGNLLLGYKVVDKRIVIDEEKAPAIRYAFEQYSLGKTKREIVEYLNTKGFTTNKGKKFTINSFQDTLRNKKYIGVNIFNGMLSEGSYPALIDQAIFDKVQVMLDTRKHAPATATAKQEFILYGKAFCGHCGNNLVGISGTSKTGEKHYYYACAKRYKEHTCDKQHEKKGYLEWYVVEQALLLLTPQNMEKIADRIIAEYENTLNGAKIKEYERQIAQLEKEFDKCAEMMMKAESDKVIQRINEKSKDLEIQLADLEKELSKLKLATTIRLSKEEIISLLKIYTRGDIMSLDYQKKIIDKLVNSVYVFDSKIVIYFNILDTKQVSYIEMLESIEGENDITPETDDFNSEGNNRVLFSSDILRHHRSYTNFINYISAHIVSQNGVVGLLVERVPQPKARKPRRRKKPTIKA